LITAVIVQARVASSRLPGKVLETLGGQTVLQHVLKRCGAISNADMVICAVPDEAESEPLEGVARQCGARTFRGPETDVLGRYLGAARANGADIILRVTSDCPLIDPVVCDAVLQLRVRETADYAANNMPPSFPHGLDCEAFTTAALAEAAAATQDAYDHEHVTPWLRRAGHLRRVNLVSEDQALAAHRWTLDYLEDLQFLRALFERLSGGPAPRMSDVLRVIERNPELAAINRVHVDAGRAGWARPGAALNVV
jgi:spore coat polysaccharide biosynthesis protein SpsF